MIRKLPPDKIAAWVKQQFPDYKTRRDGQELVICNPFDGDTGYHFNIGLARASCHDWRGDSWAGYDKQGKLHKRSFLRFVQLYLNCSVSQALSSILGSTAANYWLRTQPVQEIAPEPTPEPEMRLPEGAMLLQDSPAPQLRSLLLNWLRSRGVDQELAWKHQLYHLGTSVIWPYYEYGELVYWQSRSRMQKRFQFPKKTEQGIGKDHFLYGFDLVEPASHLILHEAIFDAMTIGGQSLAVGGAVLSLPQLQKLDALGPRDGIILAPDNDKAGMDSLLQNGELLMRRGFGPLFYSAAPELHYGEGQVTKDWNEVAQRVTGFGQPVLKLFEQQLKPLTKRELIRIRMNRLN